MQQRATQSLFAYWNGVRGGRVAPRRFEIEPSRIADLLADTFILERIDTEHFRFRLAGTRICDLLGPALRSSDFLEPWRDDDREVLQHMFHGMATQGGVGLLVAEAKDDAGMVMQFEILLLPLLHTREVADRFLGCMVPLNSVQRDGLEHLTLSRLVSHELIWPDGRPHDVIEKVDRQVPFLPHIRTARIVRSERRQFRVYDGGLNKPGEPDIR
jgi:hypothetical protein